MLDPFLSDNNLEDISIVGAGNIYVIHKAYGALKSPLFLGQEEIDELTQEIQEERRAHNAEKFDKLFARFGITNPEMIENIKKMYIEVANQNNILVIPVGIAFENAYDIKPNIVLHKEYDGSHPSLLGTYLAACVVFSSITHKSPMQIKYDYFGKIDEDDKKFLQEVAKETVEDFYRIKL